MSPLRRTIAKLRGNPRAQRYLLGPIDRLRLKLPWSVLARHWQQRTRDVLESPDNAHIVRVPNAGEIDRTTQVMHNGLRIVRGSYYGGPVEKMLKLNRGVHEPQEERVFQEVLKFMPRGATMIELGAYWAFYSMWFQQVVPAARSIMIEPESANIDYGRRNFALNGYKGDFEQAFVGAAFSPNPRTVSVDDIVDRYNVRFVDILHCDIQGFEADMLDGAARTIAAGKAGHIFISTHGDAVHAKCREKLLGAGFRLIAEADMQQTCSFDGLLVAVRPGTPSPGPVPIAHRAANGGRPG